MRRLPVTFRPEAQNDLSDIFHLIARLSGSARAARTFVGRIRLRCTRIGDAPHGGVARADLAPGLRIVPFEHSAVIAYRVEPERIRIVNVFYGGRDYEALYRRDPPDP